MREITESNAGRLYDWFRVVAAHLRELAIYESERYDGFRFQRNDPMAEYYRARWKAALEAADQLIEWSRPPEETSKRSQLIEGKVPLPPRPWRALHSPDNSDNRFWPLPPPSIE